MKKIVSYSVLSLTIFGTLIYAAEPANTVEPAKVECSSNKTFSTNTCDVCYTQTFHAKEAPTGWSSTINEVVIPWEHGEGDLDEIIYDTDQKLPTIKSTLTVTTNPTKPEDLWKNHETLIWKPFDDHKEYVIKKDEKVGLYRLAQDASLNIQGKKPDDTFLISTPLSVANFNADTNEETPVKVRNICVLGNFIVDKPEVVSPTTPAKVPETPKAETPDPATPDVAPEASNTEAAIEIANEEEAAPAELDAAGPEQPVVVAQPEQTKTKSGPEIWIALLLAFALASGYSAWKKQKI